MTSSHAPVGQLFWMVDRRFFCQKKFRSNRFGFVSDHHRFRRETRWFVVVVVFPGFFSYWLEDNLFWGPPSGWETVVCNSIISRA